MRKATKTAAMCLGILAGFAGLEHGYFEALQSRAPWTGVMFPSMGPPCSPEVAWNACEPAMSFLPSFWVTGLLTIVLGLVMIVWSAAFLHTRRGGLVLILLSITLLLFGGGFFPPLIGILGGAAGMQINKPITRPPGAFTRFAGRLWPWPLVILLVWLLGQFPVGSLFNDFLKGIMGFGLLLILSMLPLSVYSAYAYDSVHTFSETRQADIQNAALKP
jgi:hypothetical protein